MGLRRGGIRLSNRILATDVDASDDITAGDDITATDDLIAANGYFGGAATSGHHADADEVAVGAAATANAGITIQSTALAVIAARDVAANDAGRFQYDHSGTPQWEVWVEGTEVLDIRAASVANLVSVQRMYSASPTFTFGLHDSAASAGTVSLARYKGAGGTALDDYLSNEGGTFQIRGRVGIDASENLILQHNTAAGAEDATVTVGADAVTIAAATTTWADATVSVNFGHDTAASAGTPTVRLKKGAGNQALLRFQSNEGGTYQTRGDLLCDASENLILAHRDTSSVEDASLTLSAALATFSSATVVYASGGLRTGYRDLAANAALTLAASDATVHLHSTDASTVAATMTATASGHRVKVVLRERTSTGSYTLACTYGTASGTVTLNAQHEGVELVYSGSAWVADVLLGGATFA